MPLDPSLRNIADPRQGLGLVGHILDAEGAVGRAAGDKLAETVSVMDFGAVGDGAADDTYAIRNALRSAASSGGTVFFPAGKYRITGTITVPSYVTMIGAHQPRMNDLEYGSVIVVGFGAGGTTAAVYVGNCSGVMGFAFYYPDQVDKDTAAPVTFGPTIMVNPALTYTNAPQVNHITLKDLTFINAYQAVELLKAGKFRLSNLFGSPINIGVEISRQYDIGWLDNIHFHADTYYAANSTMSKWIQDNGRAFDIRHVDGLICNGLFCYGYKDGFYLYQSPVEEGVGSPWASFIACCADSTRRPIYIGSADTINFIGGDYVTANPRQAIVTTSAAIAGTVRFDGVGFWGDTCIGAIISSDTGRIVFSGCDFEMATIHQHPIIVDGDCEVIIDGCSGLADRVPLGGGNVILDGFPLFACDESLSPADFSMADWTGGVPDGWALSAGTIAEKNAPDGVEITLDASAVSRTLDYAIPTALKDRNEAYVIEFDYEPKADSTAFVLYFQICKSDGTDIVATYGQDDVFWTHDTPAKKVTLRLPVLLGGYAGAQVFRITWRNTKTADGSPVENGTLEISNLKWYRAYPKNTSDAQIANISNRILLDPVGVGITHRVEGFNIVNRAAAAPTAGAWIVGDRIMNTVPASGGAIGWVCTGAGSPGTWKTYGGIA